MDEFLLRYLLAKLDDVWNHNIQKIKWSYSQNVFEAFHSFSRYKLHQVSAFETLERVKTW